MCATLLRAKSKEKYAVHKEKKELFRTDDAVVEVTVKIKKRREGSKSRRQKSGHTNNNNIYDANAVVHKTGSYGDIFLRKKKLAESQIDTGHPSRNVDEEKLLKERPIKFQLYQNIPHNYSENIPKKIRVEDAQVQTVEELQEKPDHLEVLKNLSALKAENNLLRQDTDKIMRQVDKAKTERQEYITTIRELYQLAEDLRHENGILTGTHTEHQILQEKYLDALGENQMLKLHLQELSTQLSKPQSTEKPPVNKTEEFWKVCNVLKQVKSGIVDEIEGLKVVSFRKSPTVDNDDNILKLFDMTGGLDDTNAQCDEEIEQILRNDKQDNFQERLDVRSSTQYMDVGDTGVHSAFSGRRFLPSPISDASSSSRFSLPQSDN